MSCTQTVVWNGEEIPVPVDVGKTTADDVVKAVAERRQLPPVEMALFTEGGIRLDRGSGLPLNGLLILRPAAV